MYRQFDGYYTGHGFDLADFLSGITIVNGMTSNGPPRIANGIGCLAAQIVAHFKKRPGGIYLYPETCTSEEFVYEITGRIGLEPWIAVNGYKGPASGFREWVEKQSCEEE